MVYYSRNFTLQKAFARRNRGLHDAGFKNYAEWLKSSYWVELKKWWNEKRKKSKYWDLCWVCSVKADVLHHIKYKSRADKLAKKSSVVPVCNSCHKGIHDYSNTDTSMSLKVATRRFKKKYFENQVECVEDF